MKMTHAQTIQHRLDLLIRLIDTATGELIKPGHIRLTMDGRPVSPAVRANGELMLINTGRSDALLRVEARGYFPHQYPVCYSDLDRELPELNGFLVPDPSYVPLLPCMTAKGFLKDLTALAAVKQGAGICKVLDLDSKNREITLDNPYHLNMNSVFYAVVDEGGRWFEPFSILSVLPDCRYRIDRELKRPLKRYNPVSRVVYGAVEEEGEYMLTIRNDSRDSRWLVRCSSNEKEQFSVIDFRKPETLRLSWQEEDTG